MATQEQQEILALNLARGRLPPWMRLYLSILPLFRAGDRLQGADRYRLEEWISEQPRKMEPGQIMTVSFTLSDAADACGHKQSGQRAVKSLTSPDGGRPPILTLIDKGKRGLASLYAVNPMPYFDVENMGETCGKTTAENSVKDTDSGVKDTK